MPKKEFEQSGNKSIHVHVHGKRCMKLAVDDECCALGLRPRQMRAAEDASSSSRCCGATCEFERDVLNMFETDPRAALLSYHERSGLLHECEADFDAADLDKDILGAVKLTECLSLHTVVERQSRGSVHVWTSSRL